MPQEIDTSSANGSNFRQRGSGNVTWSEQLLLLVLVIFATIVLSRVALVLGPCLARFVL